MKVDIYSDRQRRVLCTMDFPVLPGVGDQVEVLVYGRVLHGKVRRRRIRVGSDVNKPQRYDADIGIWIKGQWEGERSCLSIEKV